jgi:hypothetical protein
MKCGVILILFLLALATSASAECSWVLWFQETFYGPNLVNEASPWLLIKATPTYALCEKTQVERIKNASKPAQGAEITVSGAFVFKGMRDADGRSLSWVSRFECLPDTVDPRGPKGK